MEHLEEPQRLQRADRFPDGRLADAEALGELPSFTFALTCPTTISGVLTGRASAATSVSRI